MYRLVPLLLFILTLSACDNFPQDARDTFNQINKNQVMRIGVVEYKPWAWRAGEDKAGGIEAIIISDFAQKMGAIPQWHFLPESEAIDLLKKYELDIVIGGLTESSPYKKNVALTRPYLETGQKKENRHVIAVPKGENRLLVALEKFLKGRRREIHARYQAEQKP